MTGALFEAIMRVYFMKGGHIGAVEFLTAKDDVGLIAEALDLYQKSGMTRGAEGFEVWDGGRFVYRWPEDTPAKASALVSPQS